MSSVSKLSICQQACVAIGAEPIASFSQQTAESKACNLLYEDLVRAVLAGHRWRFASSMQSLGSPLADTPIGDWDHAYTLPTSPECISVHGVLVNDLPVPFDRYSDKILTNAGADDAPVIHYAWRPAESAWPPGFVKAVIAEVAAELAIPVTQDAAIATYMKQVAGAAWPAVRRALAQEQTAKSIRAPSRLVSIRRS